MQKNVRLQPLQAVIQIISCFCCHLGQISHQILCWMLWWNGLHLTCKRHLKSNREEIKGNLRTESISGDLLSTRQWSWYQYFLTVKHFVHFTHTQTETTYSAHCYWFWCAVCHYTFTAVEKPCWCSSGQPPGVNKVHMWIAASSLHLHNIIQNE